MGDRNTFLANIPTADQPVEEEVEEEKEKLFPLSNR